MVDEDSITNSSGVDGGLDGLVFLGYADHAVTLRVHEREHTDQKQEGGNDASGIHNYRNRDSMMLGNGLLMFKQNETGRSRPKRLNFCVKNENPRQTSAGDSSGTNERGWRDNYFKSTIRFVVSWR